MIDRQERIMYSNSYWYNRDGELRIMYSNSYWYNRDGELRICTMLYWRVAPTQTVDVAAWGGPDI